MNNTEFGLTASVWTSSSSRAEQLAAQIDTGTVFMNRCDFADPALAWSGRRDSGFFFFFVGVMDVFFGGHPLFFSPRKFPGLWGPPVAFISYPFPQGFYFSVSSSPRPIFAST